MTCSVCTRRDSGLLLLVLEGTLDLISLFASMLVSSCWKVLLHLRCLQQQNYVSSCGRSTAWQHCGVALPCLAQYWMLWALSITIFQDSFHLAGWAYGFAHSCVQLNTHLEDSRNPFCPGDSVYGVRLDKRWKFRRNFVISSRRELASLTQGILFKFLVFRWLCTLFYSHVVSWMLPH